MLDRKELVVNKDYQRGTGLWPDSASAYFIDTILQEFTFPKIYIYEYLDKQARTLKKELVDGQQRISAIRRFYNNEFALRGDGSFKGKKFKDLDDDVQDRFLSYAVPVDVIRNANISEIMQMFRRMNAYTLPLNEAEKRHSGYHGKFKWFVNTISDRLNEFFIEYGVFTTRQITRMADAAFITDCVLSIQSGILSTSPKNLESLYKDNEENFDNEEDLQKIMVEIFNFITMHLSTLRGTFMMKPYALHSLVTALAHCKFGIASVEKEYGIHPIGTFAIDTLSASRELFAMAQAHEAKETNGRYGLYVWGCTSTVDRKARRTARIAAILRVLGANVPDEMDDNLT